MEFLANILAVVLPLFDKATFALAIGSAAYALIFYFQARKDGVIDASEKSFLNTVYTVLRRSTAGQLIVRSLEMVGLYMYVSNGDISLSEIPGAYFLPMMILVVIVVNTILMNRQKISMNLAPTLTVGSWVAYFFISSITTAFEGFSLTQLVAMYILWMIIFVLGMDAAKRTYHKRASK